MLLLFFFNQKYFLAEQGQIPTCIDVATCLGNVNMVQAMCAKWDFDICTCKYITKFFNKNSYTTLSMYVCTYLH